MKQKSSLAGAHLRTYETIFQHPISHNLKWHDVHALLEELCQVEQEQNGNIKVTRNGQSTVLHPHSTKGVYGADEIMAMRHFLERSETAPAPAVADEAHWLLVIDHHEARIFHAEVHGSAPIRILPEPYFRHPRDSGNVSKGKEKPDPHGFFEPVAKALQPAAQILVFGTGTGTSSEMDQFVLWLKTHHYDLARRIIGTVVVDEHHLTTDQLVTKAAQFYLTARPNQSVI